MTTCLSDVDILDFVRGTASEEARAATRSHVSQCTSCAELLAARRSDPAAFAPASRERATLAESAGARRGATLPSIPGYEIVAELDRGGQGIVYRALQLATRREVAVKMLPAGVFAWARARRRFEREVEIVATLRHPGIVSVFESGEVDGSLYFVMELVAGRPLDAWLRDERPPLRRRLELLVAICDAVQHAHRNGVIHRDLKPGNILVDGDGQPRVLDFGLATTLDEGAPSSLTASGVFVGTVTHASPEQVQPGSDGVDIRSDVYSLGVILFEMLTDRPPYDVGNDLGTAVHAILDVQPPRPSSLVRGLDRDLDVIALKALSKERERRYQSVEALGADVRRHLAGDAIEARRDSGWYVVRKAVRRHRLALAAAAVFLVAGVTAASLVLRERDRAVVQGATASAITDIFVKLFNEAETDSGRTDVPTLIKRARERLDEGGPKDPQVRATCYQALADIELKRGIYRDALELQTSALAFRETGRRADDPEIVPALQLLAVAELRNGKLQDAKIHLDRALAILDAHPGIHEDVRSMVLANLLQFVVKTPGPETDRAFHDAISANIRVEGRHNLNLARILMTQARYFDALDERELAERRLRHAIAMLRELHAEGSILASTLGMLGNDLGFRGRPEEGRPYLAEAVEVSRRVHGDHGQLGDLLLDLANCERGLGNLEAAEAACRESFLVDERVLGPLHAVTVIHLAALSEFVRQRGRAAEAAGLAADAVSRGDAASPQNPNARALARECLAEALLTLGEPALAEKAACEAVELEMERPDPEPGRLANAQELVAGARAGQEL